MILSVFFFVPFFVSFLLFLSLFLLTYSSSSFKFVARQFKIFTRNTRLTLLLVFLLFGSCCSFSKLSIELLSIFSSNIIRKLTSKEWYIFIIFLILTLSYDYYDYIIISSFLKIFFLLFY